MASEADILAAQVTPNVRAYYEKYKIFKTLPGQRTCGSRTLNSRKTLLLLHHEATVYLTHYATEGGVIGEDIWRARGKPVYEEVLRMVDGKAVSHMVEVFTDGTWVEVNWEGKRKGSQAELPPITPTPPKHRTE